MTEEEWFGKGIKLLKHGRNKEALEAFEKAIEIDPKYAFALCCKGYALGELGKREEALEAFEKAIEIDPKYAFAWNNKGVVLVNLGKHKDALKAYEEAIEINSELALTYANLGKLFFEFSDLENASKKVEEALNRNKILTSALELRGKIEIEKKCYAYASKSFGKAIHLDLGNPLPLLWNAYAKYLKAEFSSGPEGKGYHEEILAVIRELERTDKLCKEEKMRKYILYFLGFFYYKSKDIFAAKEKLEDCIGLKSESPIESSARELLRYIWNYAIRPPLWRWWLTSPLNCCLKRTVFVFLVLFISVIFGPLLLHPFISQSFISKLLLHPFISQLFISQWIFPKEVEINWSIYITIIVLLMIVLASPSIESIKVKDFEVKLHSPPPFEPVLSPPIIEMEIKELERHAG